MTDLKPISTLPYRYKDKFIGYEEDCDCFHIALWSEDFDYVYPTAITHWAPLPKLPAKIYYTEFGCSSPVGFITSEGVKTMEPGKKYDENLDVIDQRD